jgi:hypothetical protein
MRRALVLALLAAGCSPEHMTGVIIRGVSARLDVPALVDTRQVITFHLTVENTSERSTSLPLGINRELAFDPAVVGSNGDTVWTNLAGKNVAGTAESVILDPGERIVFDVTWDLKNFAGGKVAPGRYLVVARLIGQRDENLLSRVEAPLDITN